MITNTELNDFLNFSESITIIDVRSESEFAAGHFPNAKNFPILSDEHRKQVGICYKQKGNKEAVLLGYELASPHFSEFIKNILSVAKNNSVLLYCWRGGLRSKISADILSAAGLNIYRLKGGYKKFRNYALQQLLVNKKVKVLGGKTGSAKTEFLMDIKSEGEQIIDLENIANHRGSSFGGIGLGNQPTQEQFENNLALQWRKINPLKPLWLEDESRMIGKIVLPDAIYNLIRNSVLYKLDISFEERQNHILSTYGKMPKEELKNSTEKLYKRLGNEDCKNAIKFLEENDFENWLNIILKYYDKTYEHGNRQRNQQKIILTTKENILKHIAENKDISTAFLILGSNVGDCKKYIADAISEIRNIGCNIAETSSMYKTAPWGKPDQPDFYNMVIKVETIFSPHDLLQNILTIEKKLGRERTEKFAPRTIDIDILFYNSLEINLPHLKIPHPEIQNRKFVLVPLAELNNNGLHPTLNKTYAELLDMCEDKLVVVKI